MNDQPHFISIHDLSNEELESLFDEAESIAANLGGQSDRLSDRIMASLFFEPSTRTRLSFEAAMQRLGGGVLTISDAAASSATKGESLADSIRMASAYADLIVLRHPLAGAAKVAAAVSSVPVVNAGDGGHEHPTQTLCDLFALRRKLGRLSGLRVVVYGDLKYGRTTHSLTLALMRFGAEVLAVAEPGLEFPSSLVEEAGALAKRVGFCSRPVKISASSPGPLARHEAWLFGTDFGGGVLADEGSETPGEIALSSEGLIDAIYATRLQRERLAEGESDRHALPVVDRSFLSGPAWSRALILHPLPRLDEVHPELDQDARALYFDQAAWGVPVRMALLASLSDRAEKCRLRAAAAESAADASSLPEAPPELGPCENPGCIRSDPSFRAAALPTFPKSDRARCPFCHGTYASEGAN